VAADRVVLVDGSAFLYRAFFAIPPHFSTRDGRKTNATFGFASMFAKLFSGKRPARGAVVFDAPGKTFRDEQYPAYKAQRPPMPDELRDQLRDVDDVVRAWNFPILRVPGFEADDVIGTLARHATEAGFDVVIVSGDKDFAQLVDERVQLHDTLKDVHYDRALVKKKWGVWPEQIVDWLALTGDAVDNIPGVAGIGDKGAVQLLEAHGSLDALLQLVSTSPDALPARARNALVKGVDSARLSKTLATIDRHAPLDVAIDDLVLVDVDFAARNALYERLEFFSLLARDGATSARDDKDVVAVDVARTAADVERLLARIPSTTVTALWPAVDTSADGCGAVCGVGVVAGDATHGDAEVASWIVVDDGTWPTLRAFLGDATRPKVLHEARRALVAFSARGVDVAGVVFDTQLASFLVDPTALLPHALEGASKHWLHEVLPPQEDITGSGKDERRLADVDERVIAAFAVERARSVARLHTTLASRVDDAGQTRNLRDVDLPLARVLADMQRHGIAVDAGALDAIGVELRVRLAGLTTSIHGHAGRVFNIASTKQLGDVLFDELKLPVIKKTKTGYSTDAEVLDKLAAHHPIALQLLEHRKLDKLLNTYVDVLGDAARSSSDGRVHATFAQTTSATGRLITLEPDLQRTPVKTDDGARIRLAFVARRTAADVDDEPRVIVDADWSQIELRLLAHFSADPLLVRAYATGEDLHKKTAALLFRKDEHDVTKRERDVGKTVNFATIYGQGANALSTQLRLDKKEAQRFIDAWFDAYEGVARFVDGAVTRAKERGFAETLLGRRRVIPELSSKSPMDRSFGERVAVNTPIQGSAAEVCKVAMLRIAQRLSGEAPRARLLLQVHDELVFEAPASDVDLVKAIAREQMQRQDILDVTLAVPLVAEVGTGRSWGEAK
jgi:DNA polymerase-1